MAITLWGRISSANVQKVRWALAELGLAYEHIPVGGKHGGNEMETPGRGHARSLSEGAVKPGQSSLPRASGSRTKSKNAALSSGRAK